MNIIEQIKALPDNKGDITCEYDVDSAPIPVVELKALAECLEKYADHSNWGDQEGPTGSIDKDVVWCGDWEGEEMQPGYAPAEAVLRKAI